MNRYVHKGFTIVELLIVIVIIGILATITIVAYNGVTAKAQDAKLQSESNSLLKQLSIAAVNNGGVMYNNSSDKQELLQYYNLETMNGSVVLCTNNYTDTNCDEGDGFPKDKVYFDEGGCGVAYSYWLNSDSQWHIVSIDGNDGGATINQGKSYTSDYGPMTGTYCD